MTVRPASDRAGLDRFLKLPYELHARDPLWVPPLRMDVRKLLDRAANPFFEHAEAEYFLAFDELDLDFDPEDEDYLDSMIGLILAAQTYFLWARQIGAKATPIVLMRDDIYGRLQFPDKNKITHSFVETILWDPSPVGANSLKAVVDTRIRVLLEEPDIEDPWYLVFDEDVRCLGSGGGARLTAR